jgi:flagellar assembly protein FliH
VRARVIDQTEAGSVAKWDFPPVDASPAAELRGAHLGGAHLLTAGQLEDLQKQVHEEAQKRGFAEGLAAGKAEISAAVARLAGIGAALAQPLASVDRAVEEELVRLGVALACHLVRREIEHDPQLLQAVVHDCLAVLPSSARDVAIYMNPADAALVTQELGQGEARFKIAPDPNLKRGDARVTSASSDVDGRLETRIALLLGADAAPEPST